MKSNGHVNDYGGLVAPWKVTLIASRARRLGFRGHELEDVQQKIILDVAGFQFDPARSNGAAEITPLTRLIDNRLLTLRRAALREKNRFERLGRDLGVSDGNAAADSGYDSLGTRTAVQAILADLSPEEQTVCLALGEGQNINEIAQTLGCGWYTVSRRITRIRRRFRAVGLDGRGRA
jgi:DNA-directed RNA polymerase specialized sigma24 family protein